MEIKTYSTISFLLHWDKSTLNLQEPGQQQKWKVFWQLCDWHIKQQLKAVPEKNVGCWYISKIYQSRISNTMFFHIRTWCFDDKQMLVDLFHDKQMQLTSGHFDSRDRQSCKKLLFQFSTLRYHHISFTTLDFLIKVDVMHHYAFLRNILNGRYGSYIYCQNSQQ